LIFHSCQYCNVLLTECCIPVRRRWYLLGCIYI